ncbi:MAG: DNA-binding protein [Betaproteobacteria bacterium HGW-Betaproteobacteria-4]|jgi:excisionase family DNA binding protein|nr:MAG: DNA-binding protein [Betaproteobacteria bacterium HGW-Betaproteobacteria-4]
MNTPVQQGLPNLPTEQEMALAKEGSRELSMVMTTPEETQEITVCMGHSEQRVHLPASAVQMLMDILVNISQGNAVQVVPVHAELTTQQAADILMVSRPYLVKLLDEKKIEHRKVGSHRRIRYNDLLQFKAQEERARKAVLDELTAEAQELDMGY